MVVVVGGVIAGEHSAAEHVHGVAELRVPAGHAEPDGEPKKAEEHEGVEEEGVRPGQAPGVIGTLEDGEGEGAAQSEGQR